MPGDEEHSLGVPPPVKIGRWSAWPGRDDCGWRTRRIPPRGPPRPRLGRRAVLCPMRPGRRPD